MTVRKQDRQAAIERAESRCEYCWILLTYSPDPIVIDHIQPTALGGSDELSNLAVSCWGCNGHKYTSTRGFDFEEGIVVALFNPRTDVWSEHFAWSEDHLRIQGSTAIGRITVQRLNLNRQGLINLRSVLKLVGKHRPT